MEKLDVVQELQELAIRNKQLMKGVIYYTDNRLGIFYPEIWKECKKQLRSAFDGEIVSCSLAPIDFGDVRIVIKDRKRSYPTMCLQIYEALKASKADIVFFCEHDVLYHPSHFTITPERKEIYYYDINNYRWRYPTNDAITYSGLTSLSMLSCYRETALKHYEYRLKLIEEQGLDKIRGKEPRWARKFGYEPGTKVRRKGGVTDESYISWRAEHPSIDIRHDRTFSRPKTTLEEFKHPPADGSWREVNIDEIPEWNLRKIIK